MSSRNSTIHFDVEHLEKGTSYEFGYRFCRKKHLHQNYIHPNMLSRNHLPDQVKDSRLLDFIDIRCKLTGLIEIPDEDGSVFYGTCFVQRVDVLHEACTCSSCQDSQGKNVYAKVTCSTAYHVISNDNQAKRCRVVLFYDTSDSDDAQKVLCGIGRHTSETFGDWTALVCVTHDIDLVQEMPNLLKKHWYLGYELQRKYEHSGVNLVVIVSHPHGGPKRISIGEVLNKIKTSQARDDQEGCYYTYTAPTCSGSSGAPVYVLGDWVEGFGYWFGHPHNHSSGITDNNRVYGKSSFGVRST